MELCCLTYYIKDYYGLLHYSKDGLFTKYVCLSGTNLVLDKDAQNGLRKDFSFDLANTYDI